MSIKDRLNKKTEGLFLPPKKEGNPAATPSPLRTSPGQMLMVNTLMKESNGRLAALEDRVREFEGAIPARLIDSSLVIGSKWANRHNAGFTSLEFVALKEEIQQAGGNIQPIKVRPSAIEQDKFEIVFGHRRHRACLELNLPVLALVAEVSDKDLFMEMDRENRARLDLSPWEQGMMYRRALADGLFSSREQLARDLGIDAGNVSKALRLAELDDEVVQAFNSPLDLQYRFAKPLYDALKQDRNGVLQRARALSKHKSDARSPKDVMRALLADQDEKASTSSSPSTVNLTTVNNMVSLCFDKGNLTEARLEKLRQVVAKFLEE